MRSDELAQKFDDRPGFNLVDFEEVGLPVYKITSTVLTLQPKAYSPIEEFVLRAVEVGIDRVPDIVGFLGISTKLVESTASNLIREDELTASSDGFLQLTQNSQRVLAGENHIRPREQSLVFHYDGLTRRPIPSIDAHFLAPRDMRSRGIREIRPFPSKRPNPDEISGDELQRILSAHSSDESGVQILQVKSITRTLFNFILATALVYRRVSGGEVQVSFAIDGRLSRQHEDKFAASEGPARMGITSSVLNAKPLAESCELLPPHPDVAAKKVTRERAVANFRKQIAAKRGNPRLTHNEPAADPSSSEDLIPVYEHPKLLRAAVESASNRLIITSSWITDAVVDQEFLAKLRKLLNNDVDIYIGYGFGQGDRSPNNAVQQLNKLANEFSNFRIFRINDLEPSMLIHDEDWLVVSGFHWLSFRGDPKRSFGAEWGKRIEDPYKIRQCTQNVIEQCSAALPSHKQV